mmetsp:Transcript_30276/g.88561  ORF Transcript_30276/g.88561 Transcript_30276/m.88561 type:complete len:353 (+) Transcript_30276:86-1144(+)
MKAFAAVSQALLVVPVASFTLGGPQHIACKVGTTAAASSSPSFQSAAAAAAVALLRRRRSASASAPASSTALPYRPFTQVISDVDDTIKSSGGVNVGGVALGGIDTQYTRGDFYPGVFQFYLELSLHPVEQINESLVSRRRDDDDVYLPKIDPPKVSILTARAEEFKAALELKEDSKLAVAFRSAGEDAGVDGWGLGPVLYGSVAEWIIQDKKGLRKFNSFEQLVQQDPTGRIMQYVWVGDTGELDQEAGETMLREYPEVVKAVFLHVVSEAAGPSVPAPKLINGRPVVFFRTYVGAAARAVQLGLMGDDGLLRVMAAAEDALEGAGVPRTSDKWADIEQDMALASRTLSLE